MSHRTFCPPCPPLSPLSLLNGFCHVETSTRLTLMSGPQGQLLWPSRATLPSSPGLFQDPDRAAAAQGGQAPSAGAPPPAAHSQLCPQVLHSSPWLQTWHLAKPFLGISDTQTRKHQGHLPWTRVFINSGCYCKKQLSTGLGLMGGKKQKQFHASPSRSFLGPHAYALQRSDPYVEK